MGIKIDKRRGLAGYFDRVKQFPLMSIRDDRHLAQAQEVIDVLLQTDLDQGEQDYLDALSDLVESYEDAHIKIPDASEADILHELMRQHHLSQAKLAQAVGISQSTISSVLTGDRTLTRAHIESLASYFAVSPAAFMRQQTAK